MDQMNKIISFSMLNNLFMIDFPLDISCTIIETLRRTALLNFSSENDE